MCSSIIIKQCVEEDIKTLNQFVSKNVHPIENQYFQTAFQEQIDGKRLILLARINGELAGYAHLNFYPQYAPFRRLGIPEIQDLFVAHDYRRQGVGEFIITECEKLAKSRGASEIGLGVGVSGQFGAAQRLYARMGYIPDGAGVVFDRQPVNAGEMRPVDDRLCLMLIKSL